VPLPPLANPVAKANEQGDRYLRHPNQRLDAHTLLFASRTF